MHIIFKEHQGQYLHQQTVQYTTPPQFILHQAVGIKDNRSTTCNLKHMVGGHATVTGYALIFLPPVGILIRMSARLDICPKSTHYYASHQFCRDSA